MKLQLIWDLDGTLVDSEHEIITTLLKALDEVGISMMDAVSPLKIGPPLEDMIRNSFSEKILDHETRMEVVRVFRKIYNASDFEDTRPFKGVEEFEDELGWYTMVNMKDVWQIDMVGRTSQERNGYATQKPEALAERIILAGSRENDLVADFFCGSGTLAAAAEKHGRKWICCDSSPMAFATCLKRLYNREAVKVMISEQQQELSEEKVEKAPEQEMQTGDKYFPQRRIPHIDNERTR